MWELDYKESWALKNRCFWTVVLEETLESPLDYKVIKHVHPEKKSVLNIHWKDWCWSWNSNTLATWCEELTHLKRLWCWERLKAGVEGDEMVGWHPWLSGHELLVMDWEAWHSAVHRVAKIQTELNYSGERNCSLSVSMFMVNIPSYIIVRYHKWCLLGKHHNRGQGSFASWD